MPTKSDMAFRAWIMLLQARDAANNARTQELSKYGISTREASTLHAVHSIGERTTPADIARWAYRKPHTIAGIINRMLKKGLVKRSKDLEFKNLVRISLTEKGTKAYEDSIKRESIYRIFRTLTKEDLAQLISLLIKVRDNSLAETGDSIHRPFP